MVSCCDPLLKGLSMRSTGWESKQLASTLIPSLTPGFSSSSLRGVSNRVTMAMEMRRIFARSLRGASHVVVAAMATSKPAENGKASLRTYGVEE